MSTWIFAMNPNWFHGKEAFENLPNNQVDWGNNNINVAPDDKVLIYFTHPVQEIRILAKVVKILDENDIPIDDSDYIIDHHLFPETTNPVRLQLIRFLPTNSGLSYNDFVRECHYHGVFRQNFCLDNTQNINFRNYLLQRL